MAFAVTWLALTISVWFGLPALARLDTATRSAVVDADLAGPAGILTHAGDPAIMLAFTLTLIAVLAWWHRWEQARLVAGAMFGVALLRWGVLWLVERPRPAGGEDALGWSYPSGHTAYSATAAMVMYCLIWPELQHRWQRILLTAITFLWPVTVAMTRVQLGVHWPIDVVAGLMLAGILVTVVLRMSDPPDRRAVRGRSLSSSLWVGGSGRPALS